MTLFATNDPQTRSNQRVDFAKRLTWHRVRTRTIMDLTGLTRNRLAGCRRRWRVPEDSRLRGDVPTSLNIFLEPLAHRSETAALLSICKAFDALPIRERDYAPDGTLLLDVSIRLCDAFEAYQSLWPESEVEFDDLMLLIRELDKGELIRLGRCKGCQSMILIASFDGLRPPCSHCER